MNASSYYCIMSKPFVPLFNTHPPSPSSDNFNASWPVCEVALDEVLNNNRCDYLVIWNFLLILKTHHCFHNVQGVVIFLFSEGGAIKTPEEAANYQNVLICVEMLIAAFAHLYAFPYKDYAEANVGGSQTGPWNSLFHVLNFTDVVHDTMHQVH